MKILIRAILGGSVATAALVAQTIAPVWVQHHNGLVNVDAANKLPILIKRGSAPYMTGYEAYGPAAGAADVDYGQLAIKAFVGFVKYDDDHYLLGVRENGINEAKETDPAKLQMAASYPDRSVIWIDAKTGKPLGIAAKFPIRPVTNATQDNADFYWKWGLSDGAYGQKVIYTTYRYKILRWAPAGLVDDANFANKRPTWATTPTEAWVEPVPGEPNPTVPPYVTPDILSTDWVESSNGDGSASWRWKAFRVTGSGNNTKIFAGGGTWRASQVPQEFVTSDNGVTFYPIARVNDRGDGNGAKGYYSLGGQPSSVASAENGFEWAIQSHFPGTGWGARPGRYVKNPNGVNPCSTNETPLVWWKCTTGGYSNNEATRKYYFDPIQGALDARELPAFSWQAAGLGNWTLDRKVDGVERYDGNWILTSDTKEGVDYIVTYSMPSWNQQFGGVGSNWPQSKDDTVTISLPETSTFTPAWIGLHTFDGQISKGNGGANYAYKIPVYETDEPIVDSAAGEGDGNGGTGHDYGYDGDLNVYPDADGKGGSLVLWAGGEYGFGVFRAQNVPAAITEQPQSVMVYEGNAVSLNATVTGGANLFRWSKGGQPVPYATSSSYTINRAHPTRDGGTYKLTVYNRLGNVESAEATVTVTPDKEKPAVQYVQAGANPSKTAFWVTVVFSEPVTADTAGNKANYQLSGGIAISEVIVNSDNTVTLKTGTQAQNTEYTLTVNNIKDQAEAANVIAANSQVKFQWNLAAGSALWEFYPGISASGVDSVLSNENYPDNPSQRQFISVFSTIQAFGSSDIATSFGARISGWITPTESGNYRFFIRSDDQSRLLLSTDTDPALATPIAEEPSCCNAFMEPNPENPPTQTSEPQALVAGKSYYIEAIMKEGSGGDYLEVAWRKEGNTTPAAQLPPIAGSFLKSYMSSSAPGQFNAPTVTGTLSTGGYIRLTWSGAGQLQESADLKTWTNVAGNPVGSTTVPISAGQMKFYRLH